MADFGNDNEIAQPRRKPDAHGEAALLLVESLMHKLMEHSVISISDAVEVVDVAIEVKCDSAADADNEPEALQKSVDILETISLSLRTEIL
jgi:hypothetical protein